MALVKWGLGDSMYVYIMDILESFNNGKETCIDINMLLSSQSSAIWEKDFILNIVNFKN